MKFADMTYYKPKYEDIIECLRGLLSRFKNASTAKECFDIYREYDDYCTDFDSMFTLAYIRNSIDKDNAYYDKERSYQDEVCPKIDEVLQEFTAALLASPFRADMEHIWGTLMFAKAEMDRKTFSPLIISDLQEENALAARHSKLLASAQIDFDGEIHTLAKMTSYYENPDRAVRRAALEAVAEWYASKAGELDDIFDKLVKARTRMADKLRYENFTQLGYYRMQRHCYDQSLAARFRESILTYIVPIVIKLKTAQAKRIDVDKIKTYDMMFEYPDGSAKPMGTANDIITSARNMFWAMSEETSEFIDFMYENRLYDVWSRPGKAGGAFCFYISKFKSPFIFANFNGTSGDVDALTHEAGHAFAAYMAQNIYPSALRRGFSELNELHAMAMEFFAWPWMDKFFGEQTDKYYTSQLEGALSLLTYGAMIDEFQHCIYLYPDMAPAARNAYWLELEAKYRPWLDLEDTPFYDEGRRWQTFMHIYERPFYCIDYCLAQVMALCLWAEDQENHDKAWGKYMGIVRLAGTKRFLDTISDAGLPNPFVPHTIKAVASAVVKWLDGRSKV